MNNFQFQPVGPNGLATVPEVLIEGDGVREKRSLVSEYLSIAKRRKWLILGTIVAFVIGGL